MYLYLSGDTVIESKEIIGIFDLDSVTVSKKTRDILNIAQKQGHIRVTSPDLPRSFVLCVSKSGEPCYYLSQLSPQTAAKRTINKSLTP